MPMISAMNGALMRPAKMVDMSMTVCSRSMKAVGEMLE